MDDLIEAFKIFRKYSDAKYPTHCEHEELYVCVEHSGVSDKDLKRLQKLGFVPDEEYGFFKLFKFGAA